MHDELQAERLSDVWLASPSSLNNYEADSFTPTPIDECSFTEDLTIPRIKCKWDWIDFLSVELSKARPIEGDSPRAQAFIAHFRL